MITSKTLRSALEFAIGESTKAESAQSKAVFLDALFDKLAYQIPNVPSLEGVEVLLSNRKELPVHDSRLVASDLPRQLQCISYSRLESAISAIRAIVWECTTVSAGNCDECMGEELVFVWDVNRKEMVRQCDFCSNTLDLIGSKVTAPTHVEAPTKKQLINAGVLDLGTSPGTSVK